ncbi:accessory gene regulator ArgB-like protein [Desulfotomaculum nigrificans]|uniref:accessory gene regulator ArgB-like protein n=1 Tax=Desulfotomaculum nigrificans TaxID=1565 RepID=UPI0001FAED17|nr:accessory gene regulator B family protein [Desulfotomaculum nigrificans]
MNKIAKRLAVNITKEAEDQRPVEIIAYGLEIIFNLGTQLAILGLVSYFLGIFPEVLISVVFAIILRTFSGGSHLSSFLSCTVISVLIFTAIGYVASILVISKEVLMGLFLINSLLLARWAPYSTKRKYSEARRKMLKQTCFSILLVALLISLYLPIPQFLITAVALGLTWQSISITPLGVNIITKVDNFIERRKLYV